MSNASMRMMVLLAVVYVVLARGASRYLSRWLFVWTSNLTGILTSSW